MVLRPLGLPGRRDPGRLLSPAPYVWLSAAVSGRSVLDAACGEGEGLATLLAAGASAGIGVDASPERVRVATERRGDVATFLTGTPASLPFGPGAFDVVIWFGPLAADTKAGPVVEELRRVTAPGGFVVVSVGDPDHDAGEDHAAPAADGEDRLEGGDRDVQGALRDQFRAVRIYRGWPALATVIGPDDEAGAAIPKSARCAWPGGPPGGDEVFAVASDSGLPELPATAILSSDDPHLADRVAAELWEERARGAEAEVAVARWQLMMTDDAHSRVSQRLVQLENRPLRMLGRLLRGRPARLRRPSKPEGKL